ncbi:MAG TPA: helix-turn-helix transcriptional regulator [Haploplasma sp.]|nr:helix-turn-helix transcriptional regulator [Haploplasma sp.]
MTVGQNIKRIRTEKNLTQTQLSTRMGYLSN